MMRVRGVGLTVEPINQKVRNIAKGPKLTFTESGSAAEWDDIGVSRAREAVWAADAETDGIRHQAIS